MVSIEGTIELDSSRCSWTSSSQFFGVEPALHDGDQSACSECIPLTMTIIP